MDIRSSSTRWRLPGRGAEELPFCHTEFREEGLSTRTLFSPSVATTSTIHPEQKQESSTTASEISIYNEKGPTGRTEVFQKTNLGDYCRQHQNSKPFVIVPPPQAALSPCGNRPLRVPHQCQALTRKGINCPFKALPQAPYCKRHRKYMGDIERRSSLLLPRNNSSRFPPASSSYASSSFNPSPQHEDGLDLHLKTSGFAEEEALVPICRHCKIITLRNCNLCQSYGCKMRALSVVHEAIDLGHNRITPLIQDRPSTSNSQPSPRHRTQKRCKTLTLSDILPKLKVCRPSDFSLPATIPMDINFYVWDRWWHVKQSHLGSHAGMGLFTVHSIPKGEDLFPYMGPEYDTATFHQIEQVIPEIRYYALLYWDKAEQPGREVWIDGGTRHANLAGYINSVHGEKDCPNKANVVWKLRQNGGQRGISNDVLSYVMTVSIRPIVSGEELYTTYDWEGAYEKVHAMRDRIRGGATVPFCIPDESDLSNRRFGGQKRCLDTTSGEIVCISF